MEITSTYRNPRCNGITGHGYANLSKRNLYCRHIAGLFPYFEIGRAVRFRKSELDSALERMRMG